MLKSTVFNVDTLSFWKWKRIQCIILYTKFSKMCMFFKVSHAIETCIYIKLLFSNFYSYGAFNCVLISERDFLKIMYRKLNNEANIYYWCYPHFTDRENRFREIKNSVQITHGVNDRNGNSIHIFLFPSHFHQTMNIKKQLANVNEQFLLDPC